MVTIDTMETTTVEISVENWQWLNSLKRPGESFNDVLDRLRGDDDITDYNRVTPQPGVMPDDLGLPGSGETLDRRRMAIATMYALLQDLGSATKSDLMDVIDPDEVGYASKGSAWSNMIKGKDTLHSLPGVKAPGEGERVWRYEG